MVEGQSEQITLTLMVQDEKLSGVFDELEQEKIGDNVLVSPILEGKRNYVKYVSDQVDSNGSQGFHGGMDISGNDAADMSDFDF